MAYINPNLGEDFDAACTELLGDVTYSTLPVTARADIAVAGHTLQAWVNLVWLPDLTNDLDYAWDQMSANGRAACVACITVLQMVVGWLLSYEESAAWAVTATLQVILAKLVAARAGHDWGTPGTEAAAEDDITSPLQIIVAAQTMTLYTEKLAA